MSKYAVLRIALKHNGRDYPPHVVKGVYDTYTQAHNVSLSTAWRTDESWCDTVLHVDGVRLLERRGASVIWEHPAGGDDA